MQSVTFKNDDVSILLPQHYKSNIFITRDNHEVMFRQIITALIKAKIIKNGIIDAGAWIGDNAIPWAMNIPNGFVYAIDPSPDNISYIKSVIVTNDINNVKTFQIALSDKDEQLNTGESLDHCSFVTSSGSTVVSATTLDKLYKTNNIKNVDFIHLDVEGMEHMVIDGAIEIINDLYPIIAFEQHLATDNFLKLSVQLSKYRYKVYMIDEVLPGCMEDCRNFLAIPYHLIEKVRDTLFVYINKLKPVTIPEEKVLYSGIMYGDYMGGKEYKNVLAISYNNLYIFVTLGGEYTKMVSVDKNMKHVSSRYIDKAIALYNKTEIINAYEGSTNILSSKEYNIKNITSML